MKLVVVSDPKLFEGEAGLLNRLFDAGMQWFHLRKPEATEEAVAGLLGEIHPRFRHYVALHQHHRLAETFGVSRLHYPVFRRRAADRREWETLVEKGFVLSTSVHSTGELPELSSFFSYTFFSPVFDSISKTGYRSTLPEGFRLGGKPAGTEVIALGGIGLQTIGRVREMNFDGVAVLGALWKERGASMPTGVRDGILERFNQLNRICQKNALS